MPLKAFFLIRVFYWCLRARGQPGRPAGEDSAAPWDVRVVEEVTATFCRSVSLETAKQMDSALSRQVRPQRARGRREPRPAARPW